jgi:predicted O-methyltransferase YrrM
MTVADLLDNVRAARRRLHEAGPTSVRADGDFERVAIPHADADVLRDLLVAERAATVLEVGLACGSSALAIAEALLLHAASNARHVIVDAYQDRFHDAGWDTIVAAGLGSVCTLVRQRSQLALPRLVEEGFVADAAFVDGSHIFHNVFVDLYFVRELVRPGGLVVLDDCTLPSVATAASYFERNAKWEPRPIDAATRLRAFRLPNPPFEPHFEDFTAFGEERRTR